MPRLALGEVLDPKGDVSGPAAFDADRLTRHGVVLGMTGSGKTGLGVVLLEELTAAGVPVIAIDPKGDLANLALAYRSPTGVDLAPWVDPEEARRASMDVPAFAERTAERLRTGRAASGLDDARIAAFVDRVRVTVHTPGSSAGEPVDVLGALAAPPPDTDEESLQELVAGTVGSLLGLIGVRADPLRDPRHILVSSLVAASWAEGAPLDLEDLVVRIVDPPFAKIGVFPLETFFPRPDRLELAMALNGLIASPGFAAWRRGAALDLDALLARDGDRTPLRVFWLAHLDEAQRSFFVAMLLSRIVAWVRRQPGTSALRAVLWFDEVAGYLPPHPAAPPTKAPALTLMKQARAAGLGVVLCTQNPVDVDYKALSNAGTWWIGRLSTAQDRERVLDGLQAAEGALDRGELGRVLDGLPARTFLVRDVAERAPSLLRTRFAISFLRGPLTRSELQRLRGPAAGAPAQAPARHAAPMAEGLTEPPPPAPAGYRYRWLDPTVAFAAALQPLLGAAARPARPDGRIEHQPAVLATLHLTFDERDFHVARSERRLFFPLTEPLGVATEPELSDAALRDAPPPGALHAPMPLHLDEAKELARLEKRVVDDVLRGETERSWALPEIQLSSRGGETEESFRQRAEAELRDRADREIAKVQAKVDKEVAALERKLEKLDGELGRLGNQQQEKVASEIVNAGETLFSLFFGGRKKSLSTVMTKRDATRTVGRRIEAAQDEHGLLTHQLHEATNRAADEVAAIRERWLAALERIEERPVRLDKGDLRLDDLVVLWVPVTRPV